MICRFFTGVLNLTLLALWIYLPPCYGFDFASKTPGKLPIEIDSQQGIICKEKGRICTARGDVLVTHGQTKMHSDSLTAIFTLNNKGVPADLQRLEAQGNIRFATQDNTKKGTAGRAVYEVTTGHALFTDGLLALDLDGLQITADRSLEYFEKDGRAVATGRARAQKGDKVISAEVLTGFFKKVGNGEKLALEKITAQGNVVITTPKNAAQSHSALYTIHDDTIRLKDQVRLIRQEGQVEGACAEINLKTDIAKVLSAPNSREARPTVTGKNSSPSAKRVKVLLHSHTPLPTLK